MKADPGPALAPAPRPAALQVQRWWVNWEGIATAKHLAMQLAAMEQHRQRGR